MSDTSTLIKEIKNQILQEVRRSRLRLEEEIAKANRTRSAPSSGGRLEKRAAAAVDEPLQRYTSDDVPIEIECGVDMPTERRRRLIKSALRNPVSVVPGASSPRGRR